jgi:hypothetical protein
VTPRAALVAALAFAVGCGKHGQPSSDAAAVTGLSAVPKGAVAVVGVDVARLTGDPLVVRAVEQLLVRRPELQERITALETACHLDLTSKVKRVILAAGARGADNQTPILMVATGQITEADLTACLGNAVGSGGGKVTTASGTEHSIYEVEEGRRRVYYAFGAADTIVLGNQAAWVDQALGTGPKVTDDADMKTWLGMSGATGDHAAPMWLVAKVDPKVGEGLVRVGQGQIKAGPKAVFGSMDPGGGVKAELGAVMSSEDDAKALESFSKSQVGLLALGAQLKGLGPVVQKVAIARDSAVLKFDLALSEDEVKQLFSVIDTAASRPQDAHP